MLSTFIVNPELSVVCFRRDNSRNGPYFAVREFDIKVIRSRDKGRRGRGPSEQAIRASIRQAVLNMNLKSERATKNEIRQLKGYGILGKRAPSCSLLCAEDMIKLLAAFGKDACVRDLRAALIQDRKSGPSEGERKLKPIVGSSAPKRKAASPRPQKLEVSETEPSLPSAKRLKSANSPTQLQKSSLDFPSAKQPSLSPQPSDTNGLDALYSALLAFSNNSLDAPGHGSLPSLSSSENESSDSPCSLPSPISISPSTSPTRDPWSYPFPSSPSSPLSDSFYNSCLRFRERPSDEEESPFAKSLLSPPPLALSFSHPTVLRPRKKKKIKSRLAAEISSLSSDILAKLTDPAASFSQSTSSGSS